MSDSTFCPAVSEELKARVKFLALFLRVLNEARALRLSNVYLLFANSQIRMDLHVGSTSLPPEKSETFAAADFPGWMDLLQERLCFWPDAGDHLGATNPEKFKRIYLTPETGLSLSADVSLSRATGGGHQVLFGNIRINQPDSMIPSLSPNETATEQLQQMFKAPKGIVLVPTQTKPYMIEAATVVFANRPDACFVKQITTPEVLEEVLELAQTRFVVVASPQDDAIEMITAFRGMLSNRADLTAKLDASLLGAFVHRRVRRVCAACARSTPVDSRTLDSLPSQLRSRPKSTYLFGRGCDQCGHAAYLGTAGLSSVVEIDPTLRAALGNSVDLVRLARGKGTRSILEDGLTNILLGLTSFEEVFSVPRGFSPAFAAAVAAEEAAVSGDGVLPVPAFDSEPASLDLSEAAPTESKRLMVVEDDNDQRHVLESVFRSQGYQVFGAANGQLALDLLQKESIDLIICDVMMPVMNGAQFVKQLRASVTLKQVPVLMLTAVSNTEAECALLSHGADDYCEKNVKRKVLLKRVERLLERQTAMAPKVKNPLEHMLDD